MDTTSIETTLPGLNTGITLIGAASGIGEAGGAAMTTGAHDTQARRETRPRILAIDDAPANLMVLANSMADEFALQLASSGAAGLEMASRSPPNLILLDIMMPEMDGFEVCRRLKADPMLASIPVVFLTAVIDTVTEVSGLALGALDFLHKPINIDIARQRIKNLIERERLRRELETQKLLLEQKVAERTAELRAAKEAAEAGNRVKSVFLASMSHELRTPLGIMLGMNDIVRGRVAEPDIKDKTDKIRNAGQSLLEMIDDILQVARMESGSATAQSGEPFAVLPLLEDAIRAFAAPAASKGLTLRCEVDPSLPAALSGPAAQLARILRNFMSNAVKFSDHGTVAVRAVLEECFDNLMQVRLEVEDQGIGIPPEQMDRIFHAFTQVDDALTRRYGGIGIGLAINKHLAVTIHGSIGAESKPGSGSRFWVRVPLNKTAVAPVVHAVATDEAPAPLSVAAIEAPLARLRALLEAHDFQAVSLWQESQQLLAPLLGSRLPAFSHALDSFEFEAARGVLDEAVESCPEMQHACKPATN